jgi:hypothetical protein
VLEYGGIVPPFMISAIAGVTRSHACRFSSRRRASGTHWRGDLMGDKVDLDAVEKIQVFCRDLE